MVTIVAHPLLFSHSATCAAEQTTPNITRSQPGPALTGPVVVGVNETISIWCSARTRVAFTGSQMQELRDLFWRYSNGTRPPYPLSPVASQLTFMCTRSVPVAAQVIVLGERSSLQKSTAFFNWEL